MKRRLIKSISGIFTFIIIFISSMQMCYADVNLGNLQGALNGMITQQQVNQSTNPKLADRANISELVDPASGALTLKETDITLPGKDGFDLSISRVYNSSTAEVGTKRVKVESSSSSWTSTEQGWMVDVIVYTLSTGQYSTMRIGPMASEATAWYYYDYYSNLDLDNLFYIVYEPYQTQVITYHTNYNVTTTTFPQKYNYNRARYDLGTGWSLSFPSLQIENEQGTEYLYFHDGTGAAYRVVFSGDTTDSNLENYQGKDAEFSTDNGTYTNGQMSSSYKFMSSDKSTTYFGSDGRLLGMKDRFNNEIRFTHTNRTIYTNSSIVRATTFPFITGIVDSVGRTITFTYENSINNSTGFDGDTIEITVNDPSNTDSLSIVYIKDRTQITATDQYGNQLDQFYEPELKYVRNPRGLWTEYKDYDQITGVQSQLKFEYETKDLTSSAANISYLLGAVLYTNTASYYTYGKTTRNLGPDGATEAFRVTSRYDKEWRYNTGSSAWELTGDINHTTYAYGGDCSGYPTYRSEELVPENYEFWSQVTYSNGLTQKTAYNGKKQQTYIQSVASNNEKKVTTNEQFDSTFKQKPTRTRMDEYNANNSLVQTLYVDQTYYDWGGIHTVTQPLTQAQLNDSTFKAKHTVTYNYEPVCRFVTQKQWYQNENTLLTENHTYDTLGRMLTYTNAKGETTNYSYTVDPNNSNINIITTTLNVGGTNPSKTIKKFGSQSCYAYPTIIEEYYTDENDNYVHSTTTKTYNMLLGLQASETNNQGETTSFEYDDTGRILAINMPDFTSLDTKTYGVRQEYAYFEDCSMNAVINYFSSNMPWYTDTVKNYTDAANNGLCTTAVYAVTYYIDRTANTANVYQPSITAYDGYGNTLQQETYDYCNSTWQWIVKSRNTYDNLKRPIFFADAQNNQITYAYNPWGTLWESVDSFGNLYKTEYDMTARKSTSFFIAQEDLANYRANTSANTYKKNVIENYLDQWNRTIEKKAYPDWPATTNSLSELYGYDIAGNQINFKDAKQNLNEDGYTREYTFDGLDRIISVKDALNQRTEVTYGVLGGITSIQMRESPTSTPVEIYTKSYNEAGKLTAKTDPSDKQTTYEYNSLGLVDTSTDRNNSTFTFGYDELNSLITDKVEKSDLTASSEYKYTRNNPLGIAQTQEYINNSVVGTNSYEYNMAASVVNKDMQYTSSSYSSHLNNKYDSAGKLTSLSIATDTSGYLHTNYIYSNTRLWKVQTNGNSAPDGTGQAYAVYEYYPDGKVKKITYPKLNDNSYLTTEYIYNKLNRLESVTNKKGTAVLSQYQYTYDANGNIETINDGQETVTYEYDKLNRLQEIQSPSRGTIQYTYDIRGNRKTMQTANPILYTSSASYSYDLRDRLKSAVKGTETTNINYRSDGLRYSKTTGAQATQYHYNMAGKVVAESNTAGSFTAGYVWGPDRALVRKDAGGEYYYLYNGHGDVVQLIDRNGNVANNYEYDEWGNVLEENETVDNPFKYAGEILDDETGLYYLKARYYDPIAGRFINEDKYEGTVTNPLSINVYSYANNNPILYVDPTGNISWRQFGTLFGGVADGLLGLSDLKSLFNGEALQGMIQFGKSILSGQVNFVDIAKSIGASFVQPFQYLAEHSKNVWTGKPSDQEVFEYGKSMGSAIQTIVGAVGGGGVVGAKIVEALGKVCPKLLKAVNKVADVGDTVNIKLKYKDGWTTAQKAEADLKCKALTNANTVKTPVQRSGTSASSRYKSAYGQDSVQKGYDVDHTVDLQLGGADDILNMNPLDMSVNRSLGSQIQNQIKNYPVGTVFGQFTID